jgi:hypothetical protein
VTAQNRKKKLFAEARIHSENSLLRKYDAMYFVSKVFPVWKNVLPLINQPNNQPTKQPIKQTTESFLRKKR